MDKKDEVWLKKALKCFDKIDVQTAKAERLLEGFSMLVRIMTRNIEANLNEARALWKEDPTSEELKEKFDLLARNLSDLERYCWEKIARGIKK